MRTSRKLIATALALILFGAAAAPLAAQDGGGSGGSGSDDGDSSGSGSGGHEDDGDSSGSGSGGNYGDDDGSSGPGSDGGSDDVDSSGSGSDGGSDDGDSNGSGSDGGDDGGGGSGADDGGDSGSSAPGGGDEVDDGSNSGSGSDGDDAADDAEDAAKEAAEAAEDAADDAADAAEDAAKDAGGSDSSGPGGGGGDDGDDDRSGSGGGGDDGGSSGPGSGSSGGDDRNGSGSSGFGGDRSGSGEGSGRGGSRGDDDGVAAGAGELPVPVEYDKEGFPAAAEEVLALSSDPADRETLEALGFTVSSSETLPGTGLELLRIALPEAGSAEAALGRLVQARSGAVFALNHFFAAGRVGKAPAARPQRPAPARRGAVGVIDGGVSPAALPPGVALEAASFVARPGGASDHGSAVAALMGGEGVSKIYSADIFGGRQASAAALIRGLDWMAAKKVPVINISLAGPANPIVHRMIRILEARGHVIVAAVGNDGPAAPPLYPAAYPEVVAVTAVDSRGAVYRRAGRGPHTMLAAPGVGVIAADARGAARTVSGTSFAAPVVAARIARSLAAPDPAQRRRAIDQAVKSARDLGAPGRDPVYGYGLVGPGS